MVMNKSPYAIEDDGVTHINLYTRGRTLLGRMASNLSDCHIEHPRYGRFRTLEGLWYYLKTGKQHEYFRDLNGFECRKKGKDLKMKWDQDFQRDFKVGIICKLLAHDDLRKLLIESELPLTHYYCYGKAPNFLMMVPSGHEWQIEFWSDMRTKLKNGVDIRPIIDALLNFNPDK